MKKMVKNLFAWASIGENGKATGGKKGNQTGSEVKIGNLYNFGQDTVLRFMDIEYGRLAGIIAKNLAKNKAIGYNQNERQTLFNLAKKSKWNMDILEKELKKTKVNCDCSSFVCTIINLTYRKQIVDCLTTLTMCEKIPKMIQFKKLKYSETMKFHKGDIVIKAKKHCIINI